MICQAQTQYRGNKTVWQEQKGSGSCCYIRHKNKQTNQHTNTKLITRNGTHTNILDTKYILENLATVVTSTESHTRELGYNLRACENFVAC